MGRYELLLPIAKGGMAEVWLARLSGTRGFRKIVAIKTILRGAMDDARMEQMFIEEATLASQIHHPNTVEILDFGEDNGTLFIAMEWVEGEPVNVIVSESAKRGGLPLAIAINIIGQACHGLHAAHELRDDLGRPLGIVHRDISPQNLIVSYAGTVKVLDFGIAKATTQASTLTEAGEVKGKFAYMSPEQVAGAPLDRRSDIFSLGVLAYMLTTGSHPFRGANTAETLRKICSDTPAASPSSFLRGYPTELEAVLMRALEKDPERRFQTAHAFLEGLEDAAPENLESTFQAKLAAYMRDLLGTQQAERRKKLRLAEESSGRDVSCSMPSSTTNGSLGAVAIDGSQSSSGRLQVSGAPNSSISSSQLLTPPPKRQRRWRWLAVPAAALGVIAALFLTKTSPNAVPAAGGADSGGVPITQRSLTPLPAPELTASASASAAPAFAAPTASATGSVSSRAPRVGTKPKASQRAPGSVSPTTNEAAVETKPASPAARTSAPEAAPATREWDRSTFGGRY